MPENEDLILKIYEEDGSICANLTCKDFGAAKVLKFLAELYWVDFDVFITDVAVKALSEAGIDLSHEQVVDAFEKLAGVNHAE